MLHGYGKLVTASCKNMKRNIITSSLDILVWEMHLIDWSLNHVILLIKIAYQLMPCEIL